MGEGAMNQHKNRAIKVPPSLAQDRTVVALSFYKLGTSVRYRKSGESHHITPSAEAYGSWTPRFAPEDRHIMGEAKKAADTGGQCVLADIIATGGG